MGTCDATVPRECRRSDQGCRDIACGMSNYTETKSPRLRLRLRCGAHQSSAPWTLDAHAYIDFSLQRYADHLAASRRHARIGSMEMRLCGHLPNTYPVYHIGKDETESPGIDAFLKDEFQCTHYHTPMHSTPPINRRVNPHRIFHNLHRPLTNRVKSLDRVPELLALPELMNSEER